MRFLAIYSNDTGKCDSRDYHACAEDGRVLGLYILHPNNVGRCGHIANASYAVSSAARGKGIGRASQRSTARAFDVLPSKKSFRWFGWWGYVGSMLLLMFYTTICGWMLSYIPKMASGMFDGAVAQTTEAAFGAMVSNPSELMAWMLVSVAVGVIVCALGIEKGVERVSKFMMSALLVIMIALCVRAVTLPGAGEGLAFYLLPDFGPMFAGDTFAQQASSFGNAVYAAMGQAFFSLSVGMGGQAIFGSRIGRASRPSSATAFCWPS